MLQERSQTAVDSTNTPARKKPHWTQTPEGKKKLKAHAGHLRHPNTAADVEKRRQEVLRLLGTGMSVKDVAKRLKLDPSAVYGHKNRAAKQIPVGKLGPGRPAADDGAMRLSPEVYATARKLKQALRERLMSGMELEDVELLAHLLVKSLLR